MPRQAGSTRWRLGVVAACAFALVALVPQLHLWLERGRDWHGAYASVHPDETSYCAYINALIEGRTRRNDPYSGRDEQTGTRLPETLFSIQFIPAYLVVGPARLLALPASTAFILLAPLIAFASTLALFHLLKLLTGDDGLAATGALVVLALGGMVRAQKLMQLFGAPVTPYIFLPFLRRYLPGVAFPFFFICCAFVWRAFTSRRQSAARWSALWAGLTLAVLIFSYFFLWTAALAWLAALVLLWLLARSSERTRTLRLSALLLTPVLLALGIYARLLAHRAQTMDEVQALNFTHAPDLLRPPELLGLLLIVAVALVGRRGWFDWRTPPALFGLAFAATPLLVFNQQIITGRSLQPIHYEMFVANYLALLAAVLFVALLRPAWLARKRTAQTAAEPGREQLVRADTQLALWPARLLLLVSFLALGWGAVELAVASHRLASVNLARDEATLVGRRFTEIARAPDEARRVPPVVFADIQIAGRLPDIAPQAVLWAPHMSVFSGVSDAEYRARMYQYLYYSNISAQEFNMRLEGRSILRFWVFGTARAMYGLAAAPAPITRAELDAEEQAYADFLKHFDRTRAAQPLLSYVVAPAIESPDLTNLDRWYERDAGERVGRYVIYRVRLRP